MSTMSFRSAMFVGLALGAAVSIGASAATMRGTAPAAARAPMVRPATPVLVGVPKGLKASSQTQTVVVSGQQLSDGMAATLATPDGMQVTYGSSVIDAVTPTSFTLRVPLDQPGT